MKKYKKVIAVLAVLIGSLIMAVSVSAADSAITVSDGKATIGNGTEGVAIVATYDKNGILTQVMTKSVGQDSTAEFYVEEGDVFMYWGGFDTMKPISDAVTVVDNRSDDEVYEAAVEKALCEALGKNKGRGMTDLQKALALHD